MDSDWSGACKVGICLSPLGLINTWLLRIKLKSSCFKASNRAISPALPPLSLFCCYGSKDTPLEGKMFIFEGYQGACPLLPGWIAKVNTHSSLSTSGVISTPNGGLLRSRIPNSLLPLPQIPVAPKRKQTDLTVLSQFCERCRKLLLVRKRD